MPAFAIAALRNWKLIAIGLALAALGIGWLMLKAAWAEQDAAEQRERAALAALNQAVQVNVENVAEMARWQAEAERLSQVAQDAEARSAARGTQLRAIRAEIVADASQSCPVAPVVLRTLDGVRSLRSGPAGGHEDPGGAGAPAGIPADVPD